MSPHVLLPLALLALSQAATAQQPPGAGGQMQQIPITPAPPRAAPEIRIQPQSSSAPVGSDQARITVRALRVTGSRVYPEAELVARTGFRPGAELSLAELRQMADAITTYYRANGYFVALAYLPAQEVKDGTVTIAVSEGQYGAIMLRNESSVPDRLLRSQLEGIKSGDAVVTEHLESRLLLLSDVPGVNVRSTLAPGASVGSSDLTVEVSPGKRVSGSLEIDNGGNPYTGAVRVGGTVNINNPLGLGDVASLRLLSSGQGLGYARASYQLQLGKATVGVAYSKLDYSLGKEFDSLRANGTTEIGSVFGRYPLIRSRNSNLYAQIAYDVRTFQDRVDSVPSVTDKKAKVLMASLYGDHADRLGLGGQSSYGLTLSSGTIDIETPQARAADAGSARSNGRFNKLSVNAARVQNLGGPFSLYAGLNGQVASNNLDVSEKMQLGGMSGVRAYPEGEAYADEGYLLTLEGRMQLPNFSDRFPGRVQLIAFVDSGSVRINKEPWSPGVNRRTLSGAGVGLNWSDPGNYMVRVSYARKLGSEAATSSPDKSGRFWVQAVKYF